jgi:hypothetical protein
MGSSAVSLKNQRLYKSFINLTLSISLEPLTPKLLEPILTLLQQQFLRLLCHLLVLLVFLRR